MNFKIFSIVISVIVISNVKAITTEDLPYPLSNSIREIVSEINPIESLCIDWSPQWKYELKQDSVKTVLYKAINKTKELGKANFENSLLEGILWQYLYQINVDSAYFKVEEISNNIRSQYPEKLEGNWLKGINLIMGSDIDKGFKLLDKVRLENENLPDNFYSDYLKLSELIFLPKQLTTDSYKDHLNINILPFKNVDLSVDERSSINNQWTVISDLSNPDKFPKFSFSADFFLKKNFKIKYPKLFSNKKYKMNITLPPEIKKDLLDSLIYNPDTPPVKMTMKVLIDKLDSLQSLDRYMFDFVYKQYDEIKPLKLKDEKMVAIKCLNKSTYSNIDDQYTVFFAFDKPLYLTDKNIHHKKRNKDNPPTVRYIIALQTSKDVEDKADMLLYEMVDKLIK